MNERIQGITKVGEISKKVQERRLKWYRRRDKEYEEEGTVGGGDVKPGCVETTGQKHQPHIEMEKDSMEEELIGD